MKTNKFKNLIEQSQHAIKVLRKDKSLFRGLGIYILSLEREANQIRSQKDFHKKYFTVEEIAYCKNRVPSLMGRYAAKLAVREALQKQLPWKEMNILPSQTQQPVISIANISISITHEDDLVAAVAAYASPGKSIAVGIDATKSSRMADLVKNKPNVVKRILTLQEIKEIKGVQKGVAKRWTGKEAVSKAIGIGIWHGGSLQDIEILTYKGEPRVKLKGHLLMKARDQNLKKWRLVYMNDNKFIMAFVVGSS